MNVLALITARGGSKTIPRKNLAPLAGKPLIAWTLDVVCGCSGLDRVVVSADDEEIAAVARQHGAETPFLRPPDLARDESTSMEAVLHALHWLDEHEGYRPHYVMLLQPTSPFRASEDIQKAIALAREKSADSVVSVCSVHHHHPSRLMGINPGGTLEPHDVAYSVQRGLLQDRSAGPQWILLDALLGVFSIEQLASQMAGVEDFAEVDASSLVATCEQVKQAVTFDDNEGTVTFNLAKPFGPFLQVLASGWGSVLDMDWMSSQGAWDGGCAGWTRWHDPAAQDSVLFDRMNGTGPL